MKARDEKWVVPILILLFIIFVGVTNLSGNATWYDQKQDDKIMPLPVDQMAGWIIQGKNDFIPIHIQSFPIQKIDDIPALITIRFGEGLQDRISQLKSYKKWVIITQEGKLDDETIGILTADWKREVLYLEGGKQAWTQKITATDISGLQLDDNELHALNKVRPFFHKSLLSQQKDLSQQKRYIAKSVVQPAMLVEEEEEEEEGC